VFLAAGNSSSKSMTSSKSAVARNGESGLTGRLLQLGCLSPECQIDKFERECKTMETPRSIFELNDSPRSPGSTVDLVMSAKAATAAAAETRRQAAAAEADKWTDAWRSAEAAKALGVKSNNEITSSSKQPVSVTTTVTQKPGYLGDRNTYLDVYNSPSVAARLYASRTASVATTSTLKSQPRITMNFIPSFRNDSLQMPSYVLSATSSSSAGIFRLSAAQTDVIKREAQYLMTADKPVADSKPRTLSISSWPPTAPPRGRDVVPAPLSSSPLGSATINTGTGHFTLAGTSD